MVSIDWSEVRVHGPAMTGIVVNRIVTVFVALYWCAIFTVLAIDPGRFIDVPAARSGFQEWQELPPIAAPIASAFLLAVGSAIVAVLFAWTFVTALFEGRQGHEVDTIARNAFAGGAGLMTFLVFLGCYNEATPASMSWISLQVAALLASFSGVCAERRVAESVEMNQAGPSGVQAMAREAAKTDLVVDMLKPRLTGKEIE